MTISKRLKEFRAAKKLTVLEVSHTTGISVRTIGGYERDEVLPGCKFLELMTEKYEINLNWLITGRGSMFLNQCEQENKDTDSKLLKDITLSNDDMQTLIDMLKSDASRNLLLKFIEVKKGNKNALDTLIENLQGIRAVFEQ